MNIIGKRKIFYIISTIAVIASIIVWIAWGLNLGIDFTGGSLLEVKYNSETQISQDSVEEALTTAGLEGFTVQSTSNNGFLMRFKDIDEVKHQEILAELSSVGRVEAEVTGDEEILEEESEDMNVEVLGTEEGMSVDVNGVEVSDSDDYLVEKRFESVGPAIGQELKKNSLYAILVAIIAIILYIAYAFRQVSYAIQSWKYGITATLALVHDILITIGIFVFLGHFFGVEINTPFIAALLTILGYSVNDTIVIFDRIRENLKRYEGTFIGIVNKSVLESLGRSINTFLTTEFVLVSILVFGGATITSFVGALAVGIMLGTYSSIFVAGSLLVTWQGTSDN